MTSLTSTRRWSCYAAVGREILEMLDSALRPAAAGPAVRPVAPSPHRSMRTAALFRTPVVLVPGYRGSRSGWEALELGLGAAGFDDVRVAVPDPAASGIVGMARALLATCEAAMRDSGCPRVHLVGHSLGGVVLRWTVQQLGLAGAVGTAVTVASPHGGAPVARLARDPVVAALRPGSPLLAQLRAAPSGDVRWVAYYGNLDVVVPIRSARLDDPALGAKNVLVPDQGHISILRAPVLVRSVVENLVSDERVHSAAVAESSTAVVLALRPERRELPAAA